MDISEKAEIIVQFTQEYFGDEYYDEFFSYNDLGIPVAVALNSGLAILTDKGKNLLEETWKELCNLFNADVNGNFENLDDLTGN